MRRINIRKIGITLLLLCISITAATGHFNRGIGRTPIGSIDNRAGDYLDSAMKKALVTFAVVRSINAVISVFQESELAVSPAGVGVSFAAGQILDPLNDLIERFSWVILAATTSLGIQKLLMTIFAWIGFRLLLTAAALLILIGLWAPQFRRLDVKSLGVKLLMAALLIRYLIPLTAVATQGIDALFLADRYQAAARPLESSGGTLDAESPPDPADESSLMGKLKNRMNAVRDTVDLERRIQQIKSNAAGTIEHIIDLIVVFLLQTILIPLSILWLLVKLFTGLFHIPVADHIKTAWHRLPQNRPVE